MPIRRLTSLEEAEYACYCDPNSPELWRKICALWSFSRRVGSRPLPPQRR